MRTGLRVVCAEADEPLSILMLASPAEKRQLLKSVIDADLLVLDDLFMARRIAQESADQLQALVHKRYKLRRSLFLSTCLGNSEVAAGGRLQRRVH